MTWTDTSADASANGGNCYNCHQIEQEGDLLRHHRPEPVQLRQAARRERPGRARPPQPIVQYTWGKMWNSKAYNACSNMPRFGHARLLERRRSCAHVMALLLDPKSPVNQ